MLPASMPFSADEAFALQLDATDPLRRFRDDFFFPKADDGKPRIYLAGNSLGLMPKTARGLVEQELSDWAELGVDAHLKGKTPWYSYHETVRQPLARLVGARPNEVVCMNSLTVNLHLLLATFYRPEGKRFKILMDEPVFPSDAYAIRSQIAHHGFDPAEALILAKPREGEASHRIDDLASLIEEHRDELAVVLIAGVNFFTGQKLDVREIAAVSQKNNVCIGVDLAHAIGNVPVLLHDWNVDFAVWCSYKYLNAGPGSVGGAFVHERHASNPELPRLAGWWGNDPATRFRMQLEPEFKPVASADSWQISNPPILSMTPLRASLAIFDAAGGIETLRKKSIGLTAYLQFLLDEFLGDRATVITPRDPEERGCQLSIAVRHGASDVFKKLEECGVTCDFREPNVIRAAPTPLYNSFHEVWRFAQLLRN
jgi:kynureninase